MNTEPLNLVDRRYDRASESATAMPPMSTSLDLPSVMSALENASDLELPQLRTAIAHLLENPKRILAMRQKLHTGMAIEYWSLRDRRMQRGRIAQFKPDQVLIHRDDGGHVWVEYAAPVHDPCG